MSNLPPWLHCPYCGPEASLKKGTICRGNRTITAAIAIADLWKRPGVHGVNGCMVVSL